MKGSTARLAAAVTAAGIALAGCGGSAGQTKTPAAQPSAQPTVAEQSPAPTAAPIDPAAVKANELGVVPVLMYHQVVPVPKGIYDQTPKQFRDELELLYSTGYVPVTAASLATGQINLPAGKSPVVLTFDDSTASQYNKTVDGQINPDSAVGIMLEVAKKFDAPPPVATFYVNGNSLFGGKPEYVAELVELGMEIGNHTIDHNRLDRLDASGVQRALGSNHKKLTELAPDVKITTMALPLGIHPKDKTLAHTGSGDGQSYKYDAVMLVGAHPASSPHSAKYVGTATPRILSGRDKDEPMASYYWLEKIKETRYVSDGNSATVSFPKSVTIELSEKAKAAANAY